MPRPKQSTVRVKRDTYQPKGQPKGAHPIERWRVYVHHRSTAGNLTRRSFLAPVGASEARAKSMGERMLARMQAEDEATTREAVDRFRQARGDDPGYPPAPATQSTNTTTPTVAEFSERYMVEFCEANRQAPGTLTRKRTSFALHLIPAVGDVPLGEITGEHVQQIKAHCAHLSERSVNAVLGVFRAMLRVAEEWNVIERTPRVRMVKVPDDEPDWFEVDDYQALCEAAATMDLRTLALVLLGGDGGLRRGEIMALKWADIDWKRNRITVRKSRSRTGERSPKNGKIRHVPMTPNLQLTLQTLRGEGGGDGVYVLWTDKRLYGKGREPLYPGLPCANTLRHWLRAAQDRANLPPKKVHSLRHSFCSHLAERGVPPTTIMRLAGHADLRMTQRYTHVATTAPAEGIQALDRAPLFGGSSKNRAKTPEPPSYLQ